MVKRRPSRQQVVPKVEQEDDLESLNSYSELVTTEFKEEITPKPPKQGSITKTEPGLAEIQSSTPDTPFDTSRHTSTATSLPDDFIQTPSTDSPDPSSAIPKTSRKPKKTKTEYATLFPHGLAPVETAIDNHWIYLFFRFCGERHRMQEKRDAGVPRDQLSQDETMCKTFVGNVFRELDAGSKKMKGQIIAEGEQTNEEICFRVFLYCAFYNSPTWDELVKHLGEIPSWKKFDLEKYEAILYEKSFVRREVIYTSGFQLVPPTMYFKKDIKLPHYAASLRLVQALMEMGMPERLRTCGIYAIDASETLRTAPTLGGFLSLNLLCYLNDSKFMKFYYRNFATCGPGSRKFLQRMFGKETINSIAMEEAGLKWLYDNQWRYWARLGEDPPHAKDIPGIRPGMRVLDFENALCWCHRYVNDFTSKGYRSLADIPHPVFDSSADEASMPAWCDQEAHVSTSSRAAFLHDYDEARAKLDKVVEGEEVYEVEKIVCRKGSRNDRDGLFRVRWKGYPPEEDTWERASVLVNGADEALKDWLDWEEKVWSTIDRIKNDCPYKGPVSVKSEDAGVTLAQGKPKRISSSKGTPQKVKKVKME